MRGRVSGAPLDEDGVSPLTRMRTRPRPRDPFSSSDDADALGFVEPQTRSILGEDAGLYRPDAGVPGGRDERLQQESSDPVAPRIPVDIDRVLDPPAVCRP